jgi:hypothetical protein
VKKGLILQAADCESDKRSDKRHFHAVGNDGDIDDKPSRLLSPMSHRRPRQSRQMSLTSLMSLEELPCVRFGASHKRRSGDKASRDPQPAKG